MAGPQLDRIAEIIVESAEGERAWRGSGYLVQSRSVLTAAHVVSGAGRIRVRFEADRQGEWTSTARVALAVPGADVAVLEIDARPAGRDVSPALFGTVGGQAAPVDCVVVGFPRFKLRGDPNATSADAPSRYRDSHQATGAIYPLSNWRVGDLEIAVSAQAPDPDPGHSPWEGMSGAAVWCKGRIVGVISQHHPREGLGRLAAVRVDRLYRELEPGQHQVVSGLTGLPASEDELPDISSSAYAGVMECPYRGLQPFAADDARFFFGRDEAVGQLLEAVAESPLVTLIGASGSGKSSVLAAGLVPAASATGSPGYYCALITPTEDPVRQLSAAISRWSGDQVTGSPDTVPAQISRILGTPLPEQPLLLIVDQMEELHTLCDDDQARRTFIRGLLALSGTGTAYSRVVIGVRTDFYDEYDGDLELGPVTENRNIRLGQPGKAELRAIIEEPAALAGLHVDPRLTEMLLSDVGHEPGRLPLLSHVLLATFERRQGPQLTVEDYIAAGRLEGAVNKTADEAYESLSREEQDAAQAIFLRCTAGDGSIPDTRRPVRRADLDPGTFPGVDNVLSRLLDARLVTLTEDRAGEQTVEVAHEVLIRSWRRLTGWLDTYRRYRPVHQNLIAAAGKWDMSGRDPGWLYHEASLKEAQYLSAPGSLVRLTRTEQDFLSDSRKQVKRRTRRILFLTVGVVIAMLAAGAGTYEAITQSGQKNAQQRIAISQRLASEASGLAGSDPGLAKQLAVVAYQIDPTPTAFASLFNSQEDPGSISAAAADVAFSDNGSLLALLVGQRVELWSMAAHAIVAVLPPSVLATSIAFQPGQTGTGGLLAVGESSGQVELWDVGGIPRSATLRASLVATTSGPGGPVEQVAFSPAGFPAGPLLAAAGWHGTVTLWDVMRPGQPRRLAAVSAGSAAASSVGFAAGHAELVTGDWDHAVRLWNISDPRQPVLTATIADGQVVRSLAVDSTSRFLAVGGDSVRLWNISNPHAPRSLAHLSVGDATTVTVAFSPTASVLMASSTGLDGGKTFLWDMSNPASPVALPSISGGQFLATSSDGQLLATGGPSGREVRLWNIADPYDRHAWAVLPNGQTLVGYANSAIIDPSGRLLALMTGTSAQLWNVTSPSHPVWLGQVPDVAGTASFAYRNGQLLMATAGEEGVTLWNATDPAHLSQVAQLPDSPLEVALSPDGQILAMLVADTYGNMTIRLWSIRNPKNFFQFATLAAVPDGTLAFGLGGQTLLDTNAYGLGAGNAVMWDLRDPGKPVRVTSLPSDISQAVATALSPVSPILAAADANGAVSLWNLADPWHPSIIVRLSGDSAPQENLVLGPNGDDLAGYDSQGNVRLWSAQDSWGATTVSTIPPSTQAALSGGTLPAAPSGTRLLVIDTAQGSSLLNVSPSALIGRMCAQAGDPITAQQWQQYVPGLTYQPPCGVAGLGGATIRLMRRRDRP